MKKNILITLFFLISIANIHAEISTYQERPLKWNIQTRPFYPLIRSGLSMLFNYQLSPSIAIGPDITFYQDKHSIYDSKYSCKSYTIGINSIYFFSQKGIVSDGATLTGNISYGKYFFTHNSKNEGVKEKNANSFSSELLLGYHWTYSNHITLDIGIGGKYMVMITDIKPIENLDTYAKGSEKEIITPTAEFTIGYAF